MKVIDTTFLIDLLEGKKEALVLSKKLEGNVCTTQINLYELIRGIFLKYTSYDRYLQVLPFFDLIPVLPLDDHGIIKASAISAQLMQLGKEISDTDCLIAGIALSNNVDTIITRNVKHFRRIKGLKVETY